MWLAIDKKINSKGYTFYKISFLGDSMRFIEDQFVVWGEYPAWNKNWQGNLEWHYPAGLEQYFCYCPIDSSSSAIILAFADMYKLKGDRLYLEKAMTLADKITRV